MLFLYLAKYTSEFKVRKLIPFFSTYTLYFTPSGYKFDLLIYEFFSFTAFSAAQKLNIKTVRLFSTFAVSRENIGSILISKNKEINLLKNKFMLRVVTKLVCGKIPLVTPNILTEITDVSPDLNIVFTTKEFQKDSNSFNGKYHFVGPLIGIRVSDLIIPFDQMGKTIIYVSLGTLQNQNLAFYRKCMEAFKNKSGVSVVMSVGKNTDIAKLGNIPSNFYRASLKTHFSNHQKCDII